MYLNLNPKSSKTEAPPNPANAQLSQDLQQEEKGASWQRDNGKENGNYWDYRGYIGIIRDYIGIIDGIPTPRFRVAIAGTCKGYTWLYGECERFSSIGLI